LRKESLLLLLLLALALLLLPLGFLAFFAGDETGGLA
jgi:hypothetical protein